MASGLPLVVTAGGPGAELAARSGAGLTFPAGDLGAAAEALAHLAAHPQERLAMARQARAHAAARDWPVAFARFADLCRNLTQPPPRASDRRRRLRRPLRRARLAWRRRRLV
jgi:glycosyltransferase involved in cell wall biosynthesis